MILVKNMKGALHIPETEHWFDYVNLLLKAEPLNIPVPTSPAKNWTGRT